MTNLKLKRKSLELAPLEKWLAAGRGGFHFENIQVIRPVLQTVLRLTGLLARGERNALGMRVAQITLEFENLPSDFSGFRILFLSDIHADGTIGLAEAVSERIRDIEVDLCLLGGDYRFEVYGPCHNIYPPMRKILSAVKSRLGIFGILGNHDFTEVAEALSEMGVRMLMNEAVEIKRAGNSLWVVGLDDPHYYGTDDLPGSLNGVPENAFKILLVHTPEMIEEAERNGFSLYLCGHTHAGQICLPLLGPIIVHAKCPRHYTRGVWTYGSLQGYTSAGVGCSVLPVRFLCPPEVGLIELKRCPDGCRGTSPQLR